MEEHIFEVLLFVGAIFLIILVLFVIPICGTVVSQNKKYVTAKSKKSVSRK